jgi:hypothetical protein
MPRQTRAPAILVNLLAIVLLIAPSDRGRAAEECVARPGAAAPAGSHWYYRLDRLTHAHCWYLGPLGTRVVPAETHAQPSALPLPVARPTLPSGETAYASADAGETTAPRQPREGEATFAMRWLAPSVRPGALALASVGASDHPIGDNYTAEPAGVSETEAPSIEPVRAGADRESAAARGARPLALVFAMLAAALASIALTERAIFRRLTVRGRVRLGPLQASSGVGATSPKRLAGAMKLRVS